MAEKSPNRKKVAKIWKLENVQIAETFENRTIPKKGRKKKIKNFKTRKCAIWRIRDSWELDNSKRSKLQKNLKIWKLKIIQVSKIWKLENAKSCRIRESWELATGSCQGRSIPCNAPRTNTRISTTKEEYRLQMKKFWRKRFEIRKSKITAASEVTQTAFPWSVGESWEEKISSTSRRHSHVERWKQLEFMLIWLLKWRIP